MCSYNVFRVIFCVGGCVGGGWCGIMGCGGFRVLGVWVGIVMWVLRLVFSFLVSMVRLGAFVVFLLHWIPLIYMIISSCCVNNNHALFRLWWEINLVKHQNVSNSYEHHCTWTVLWKHSVEHPKTFKVAILWAILSTKICALFERSWSFRKYRKVFCNFLAINLERIMLISGTGKHLLKFANFLACFCWAFEWSEEKKIWIS